MHLPTSIRGGLIGIVSLAFLLDSSQIATPAQAPQRCPPHR